jgi:sterol 14-demethylase
VERGVKTAYTLFSDMVTQAKRGGEPMGPVMQYYDEVTKQEDPDLTAKFCTAAFWGGSGNSVPSTMWTFGMVLADPSAKRKAYAEVDGAFANEPNAEGHYDFDKLEFITAALKEVLRMKTYSIAWRQAQSETVLTSSKSGKTYLLPKGTIIGLHFAMRHMDPNIHPEPHVFRPERFLGTGAGLSPTINGHSYAWVPFSAGRHKCSGYALAMLEIPVIMALALREYDMEILDPLPGLDFQAAFGVIGADETPVRVRYTRRRR